MALMDDVKKIQDQPIVWHCHHRLNQHEVGCPHRVWTAEQLREALVSSKKSHAYLTEKMVKK